ncbi:MAG: hypothetical protein WC376_00775 [Candidatus Nanoarchaeia archaeon]|jgi:hypothetical protein
MVIKDKILEFKKSKFKSVVESVCKARNLSLPTINFDGCSEETENQLAHYHKDNNTICVSERQLNKMNSDVLENNAAHEVSHILEFNHSSSFHNENAISRQASFVKKYNQKSPDISDLKEKEADKDECAFHLCHYKGDELYYCSFCKKYYCHKHKIPKSPSMPNFRSASLENEDKLYDYRQEGHPCPNFRGYYHEDVHDQKIIVKNIERKPKIDIKENQRIKKEECGQALDKALKTPINKNNFNSQKKEQVYVDQWINLGYGQKTASESLNNSKKYKSIYDEDNAQIKNEICDFCKDRVSNVFYCEHCNKYFCYKHRNTQSHNCKVDKNSEYYKKKLEGLKKTSEAYNKLKKVKNEDIKEDEKEVVEIKPEIQNKKTIKWYWPIIIGFILFYLNSFLIYIDSFNYYENIFILVIFYFVIILFSVIISIILFLNENHK